MQRVLCNQKCFGIHIPKASGTNSTSMHKCGSILASRQQHTMIHAQFNPSKSGMKKNHRIVPKADAGSAQKFSETARLDELLDLLLGCSSPQQVRF